MDDNNVHIDQLFVERLGNYEADFSAADWDAMNVLLDTSKKRRFLPFTINFNFKKFNLKSILIMTTLIMTGIAAVMLSSTNINSVESRVIDNQPVTATIAENTPNANELSAIGLFSEDAKPNAKTKEVMAGNTIAVKTEEPEKKASSAIKNTLKRNLNQFGSGLKSEVRLPALNLNESIAAADSPVASADLVERTLIKKTWVEPTYRWEEVSLGKEKDWGWIGVHYSQDDNLYNDSFSSQGFDVQYMGPDLIPTSPFNVRGGFDWGMQFAGKGKKTEVILNTATNSLGYTFLSSLSHDFHLRFHAEYDKFFVVPYVTAFAGPRVFFTGQTVGMYNAPDSIDPKSRQNIESIGTFAYGGGVGARIKVGKHVSFDAKYEIMQGGAVNMIDKYNSRLVGTDFLLNRRNIETNYGQFKVGVLFHLFEEKTKLEKVLEKEGYYKEEKQTYYVDPENSDKIIVPCDCGPCDNQTTAPSVRYLDEKLRWLDVLEMMGSGDDWNSSGSGDNWGSGSSGGGSSGGRGSTPSIKSGVGNH